MKKIIIGALIMSFVLMLIISFNRADIEFQPEQSQNEALSDDGKIIATKNIILPIATGSSDISNEINIVLSEVKTYYDNRFKSIIDDAKELNKINSNLPPLELAVNYTYVPNDYYYSLEISEYSYLGGAHGSSRIYGLNFNKNTGELATYESVFIDDMKKIEEVLLPIVRENLLAQELDSMLFNPNLDELPLPNIANFLFTDDGIRFYYEEYEIAPYVVGVISIEIKYEDIQEILKLD